MNFATNLSSKSKLLLIVSFIFILIALPLFIFLATNKESNDNRSHASLNTDAETLTKELFDPSKDEASKLNIANQRNTIMESLAIEDPESFILNVISPEMKNQLPTSVQNLVENQIDAQGNLTQNISEEDAKDKSSNFILQELDNDGFVKNAYIVYLREGQSPAPTVKIKGYLINNILVPNTINPISGPASNVFLASLNSKQSVLGISTSGNKKVAILMVNFKQDKSDTNGEFTKAELDKIYFSGDNAATKYLNTASNGQVNLNGDISDIYGWITLPNYTRKQVCDIYETGAGKGFIKAAITKAEAQAKERGKNFDNYEIIGFVFPYANIDCNWGSAIARGVGNIDSNAKPYHFLNGNYCAHSSNCSSKDLKFYGALIAHEMGHNLGLSHANGLSCGSKVIDSYGKCKSITYGDRFDISGGDWTYTPQSSASNQIKYLNWIPAENQKNVNPNNINQTGTYTLYSISKKRQAGQLQFLRIPRPVEGGAYYIETRSKDGLDNNLPSNLFGGAIIRLSEVPDGKLKDENGNPQYRSEQTYLINPNRTGMTNWTQFLNPALSDGKSFIDTKNGIKITQLSHNQSEGTSTLKVEFLPTSCQIENPIILVDEPSESGIAGEKITYSFKLKNPNPSVCKEANFTISASAPSDWIAQISNPNTTLGSGQSTNLTVSVTSPKNANISNSPFKISIKAVNKNKTTSQSTKEIRYNLLTSTQPANLTIAKAPTVVKSPTKSPTYTPTPIPTSGPIPSTAIDSNSTYIKMVFGLQGIGKTGTNTRPDLISGNSNPAKKTIDIKVKIVSTNNTQQEVSGIAYFDSTQEKYISTIKLNKTLPTEINNLFVSVPSYLTERIDAKILANKVNDIPTFNLSGGDIDENGERNILDWNLLNACSIFKFQNKELCPENSKLKTNADMNSDGIIDQSDITLFYQEIFGSRKY